jgi:DNA ligase D-like protein (predicted 3'-phosphoesterase)
VTVAGQVAGLCPATRSRALELGLRGWVRAADDGGMHMHAEGPPTALDALMSWLRAVEAVPAVDVRPATVEGHEQFAVRGVPAGVFVIQERQASAHQFELRLEVGAVMRSWALPKGPSLDPAVKRFAIEIEAHDVEDNAFEGHEAPGATIVWDRGTYEQGGRVRWPEALDRGHAVFVLHGAKLRGGFALQRTRRGDKPQWLLVKRRDEHALPGSDIVTERPESVASSVTLAQLLGRVD